MERRRFGPLRREVPIIGQGTWNVERDGRAAAVGALRQGLDLGLSHVDTAEMYGSGVAEEWVGEAIAGRRDDVFLVSKVLPQNASRRGTRKACEASLRRLGTDRLDCYLLHWPGNHPLADTLATFEELRAEGKILAWGVSNFDVADLEDALRIGGPGKVACNQVLYHLKDRGIEHAVIPWCEAHGVAVVAYSPFGSGRFPNETAVLEEIGKAHAATAHQVALRYLVRRPSVFAIPKASRLEHVAQNAGAASLQLSDDDVARLDQAFPLGRRPRQLPTL